LGLFQATQSSPAGLFHFMKQYKGNLLCRDIP
jgi:hypothetical protein